MLKLFWSNCGKAINPSVLTKFRDAVKHRREKAQMLFSTECFGTSQYLSVNSKNLYHGTKSNILQRIEPSEQPS